MEYTRFGDGYLQRRSAREEWKPVPADDEKLAGEAIEKEKERVAYEKAHRPPSIRITRGDGSVEEIP